MSTSLGFTGSAFFLETVTLIAPATVRVRYTQDPLAASSVGANDALNPLNYTVVGPGPSAVLSCAVVSGDPQSIDLFISQSLGIGLWVVTVASNVQMTDTTSITTPRSLVLTVSFTSSLTPVSQGALNDSGEDIIRKFFNPALVGAGWNAVIAAIATGEQKNRDNIATAFNQLYKISGSGIYLERKSADDGLERPVNIGMSDDVFRQYSIKLTNNKLVESSLLDILEVFYGVDSVRASCTAGLAETYSISDGDDLTVLVDERQSITTNFSYLDFASTGACRAAEVAAALTRSFQANGSKAYAVVFKDPQTNTLFPRIYSGSKGLLSSVRVTGGKAQNALQFSSLLPVYSGGGLPVWNITFAPQTNTLRFTTVTASAVDFTQLQIGDYVNIYGNEFLTVDKGTFAITNVSVSYPSGVLTQFFEVINVAGVAQAGLTQLAFASVNYFRPVRRTIQAIPSRAVKVSSQKNEIDIVLPATSQAVGRNAPRAAYGQVATSVAVTSLRRLASGVVTVAAPAHGLLVGGQVFIDGSFPTNLPAPIVAGNATTTDGCVTSNWSTLTALLGGPIYRHTATLLANGNVLTVCGGNSGNTTIPSLFTTACNLFTLTGTSTLATGELQYTYALSAATTFPTTAVAFHGATLVAGPQHAGDVLVTGGRTILPAYISGTWFYTPTGAGVWTGGPAMTTPRATHTSTSLPDGRILVASGCTTGDVTTTTAELWTPSTNLFAAAGTMLLGRSLHTATAFKASGVDCVLVAGGNTVSLGSSTATNLCEYYQSVSNTWVSTGAMSYTRWDHGSIKLPDGRILVAGGMGYNPTQSSTPVPLPYCEIYDPASGCWSPADKMSVSRSDCTLILNAAKTRVYAFGGQTKRVEFMDLATLTWQTSVAPSPANRQWGRFVQFGSDGVIVTGGIAAGGANPSSIPYLLQPASEKVGGGGLNNVFAVQSVIDANNFTIQTPQVPMYSLSGAAVATPCAAPAAVKNMVGPYAYDTKGSPAVTKSESTITQSLSIGAQYASVGVADATQFPDAPGWLVFAFGTSTQVYPVYYLGRLSPTSLSLDYSFVFPATVASGSKVTLLYQRAPFVPATPQTVGSFYVTDSPSGRVAASAAIDASVGEGILVQKTVTYPGDRGLGGEGLPVSNVPRISDKVEIWAGDSIDAEVATARSGS